MHCLLLVLWLGRLPGLPVEADASPAPGDSSVLVPQQDTAASTAPATAVSAVDAGAAASSDTAAPVVSAVDAGAAVSSDAAAPVASAVDAGAAVSSTVATTVPAAPKPAARAEANSAKPPTPDHRRPPLTETASYRVNYSILGEVAEATITFTPGPGPSAAGVDPSRPMVRATGTGKGAVLGFGKTEKRIESEFDTRTLKTTRWTITRSSGDETVIDSAEQQEPGKVSTVRKRAGKPDEAVSLTRSTAVLDPLGFLLRLRLGPLQAPATFEILDGHALWIANISAVRRTDEIPPTLRIDGRVDPIFWDGRPADDRTSHNFSLFLSNDGYRTPVRLTVPFGLGEARAEIVQLSRYATARRAWRGIMPIVPRFLSLKKRPGMGANVGPASAK